MTELSNQKCVPCSGNVPTATEAEINDYKTQIPKWEIVTEDGEKRLQREYQFPDLKKALSFTDTVGEMAEEQGHHPTLLTEWGKVTVTWWTHAIGGLHHNDFIMAAKCDRAYE